MTRAYGAAAAAARLAPLDVPRRTPGPRDVEIAVDWHAPRDGANRRRIE